MKRESEKQPQKEVRKKEELAARRDSNVYPMTPLTIQRLILLLPMCLSAHATALKEIKINQIRVLASSS